MDVNGTNNTTTASQSTINFTGDNSGNTVHGEGNTGSNWGARDSDIAGCDNGGSDSNDGDSTGDGTNGGDATGGSETGG